MKGSANQPKRVNQLEAVRSEVAALFTVFKLPFVGPDLKGTWPTCDECQHQARYVYLKGEKWRCYHCIAETTKKGR